MGVGDYESDEVNDLEGPPNGVQRIYELLTNEKGGYGFPKKNVCKLVDKDATTKNFKDAFEKGLIDRARKG
uniref:Uncharacterized protein n=1 Tax=Candidatus Kentrum sp. SD TaxID=2126332 RepID=A0A450YAT1_9GAMM|nr:MAG: hypothetical protein BECKSD772F_GA0070984_100161 [Candidatus Kentron sp. SD]VFK38637.1 MAG: hypothetical protein BECKSD772E_GA0070983_100160 [Candidatus Kentron sp. SD]